MIDFEWVITNGYVDSETIESYTDKGWTFVATIPAKLIHPYACDTDKATVFSKYTIVEEDPLYEEATVSE
jgi:hypothetical protein